MLGQCTGRWTEMHAALTTRPQTAVRKKKKSKQQTTEMTMSLTPYQKVHLPKNLEQMLAERLKDANAVL